MQNTFFRTVVAVAIAAGLGMAGSAMADEVKLPKKISWTAYGTMAMPSRKPMAQRCG
jgi:hypothetical protein